MKTSCNPAPENDAKGGLIILIEAESAADIPALNSFFETRGCIQLYKVKMDLILPVGVETLSGKMTRLRYQLVCKGAPRDLPPCYQAWEKVHTHLTNIQLGLALERQPT